MIYYNKKEHEENSNIIAGLEIGSSTISCFIASVDKKKKVSILGFAYNQNLGMANNKVVDIKKFRISIQNAIRKAEENAGVKIKEVFVSSSTLTPKTKLVNSLTEVPYGKAVSALDLKIAFGKLKLNDFQDDDNKILHIIPVEYRIDGKEVSSSPIGLFGSKLQVKYNVISTNRFAMQNINNLVKGCLVDIKAITTSGYSSCLTCMEMLNNPMGNYVVMDIGASNIAISMFSKGRFLHISQLSLGSDYITMDIAKVLNTDLGEAERIKNLYGSVEITESDFTQNIDIMAFNDNNKKEISSISKGDVCNIIRPRVEEILSYVKTYLESRNALIPLNKILITGGGANLNGIKDMAEDVFGKPIAKVVYNKFENTEDEYLDTRLASLWGLLEYKKKEEYYIQNKENKKFKIIDKIKDFFENNF